MVPFFFPRLVLNIRRFVPFLPLHLLLAFFPFSLDVVVAGDILKPIPAVVSNSSSSISPNDHRQQEEQQQLCVLDKERSAFYASVPENAPKGTLLGSLPINGLSSGPNATIRLKLMKGRDYARLNPLSKKLLLRKELDREQGMSRFEVVIECTPLATKRPSTPNGDELFPLNISVFVTVTDVNDNAPEFPQGIRFSMSIPEELPQGTALKLDFGARDRDQPGPNSHIRYRILRSNGDSGENTMPSSEMPFAVSYDSGDFGEDAPSLLTIPDPFRPELVVAGRIDFERMPKFTVLIEAEDQGQPKLRTLARLEVRVLDVDDQNPVFSVPIYSSRQTNKGSELLIEPGPIRAWDADHSFNESIVFALSGDHSVNYAIDELTGVVTLLADELRPTKLIIWASQLNRSERNATAFLVVEPPAKTDEAVKENNIEFVFMKITSDLAVGTKLMELGNKSTNGTDQNFELLGTTPLPAAVYVDGKTNCLRLSRPLPVGEYNVRIANKSAKGLSRRLNIRLVVVEPILPEGMLLPRFNKDLWEFELDWRQLSNSSVGEKSRLIRIGQIRAGIEEAVHKGHNQSTDEASREGNIVYSLLNGNRHFELDPKEGILWMRKALNDSPSSLPPALDELVVMAEADERRTFATCTVRLINRPSRNETSSNATDPRPSPVASPDELSPTLLALGIVCFLLLATNCATLSLWLGKRRFAEMYDQLAYRYDSQSVSSKSKCATVSDFGGGGTHPPRGNKRGDKNNAGGCGWMLNRSLEGNSGVSIGAAVTTNESGGTLRWAIGGKTAMEREGAATFRQWSPQAMN